MAFGWVAPLHSAGKNTLLVVLAALTVAGTSAYATFQARGRISVHGFQTVVFLSKSPSKSEAHEIFLVRSSFQSCSITTDKVYVVPDTSPLAGEEKIPGSPEDIQVPGNYSHLLGDFTKLFQETERYLQIRSTSSPEQISVDFENLDIAKWTADQQSRLALLKSRAQALCLQRPRQ